MPSLSLLAVGINIGDHGFPLLSSSRTRSPTRATYPTTTCSCPSPIPCPSPTVCPVTKCPTVTRYPVITPCPSPKPCPAVTANPSTSVCRCPAITLADCSKCTLTTQTITCRECSGIEAQNVILSSDDQAVSPGPYIGAALGGAVLGSSFTVIAFVCIRRRCKTRHTSKKDDQISKSAKKTFIQYSIGNKRLKSNDSAAINSISAYCEIHDELRKSATIIPLKQQKNMSNEVYNHLHESDKEYRSDFYDHAGPAPSLSVMEDGYGVLSTDKMVLQFVCRVVLVLIFIHVSSSQSTPCHLQIERNCVYESLDKFKIYRGMECENKKLLQKLDFTSSCEVYCTLTINVCTDNKELGVTLDITSLNVSISSSSSTLKKVVMITCNFSSATDPHNCIQGPDKYSTTNILPRTSDLIVSQTTQEVRTKQFISEIGFTLGNIIGAVVGGALFGTITTAIIAVFMYRKSSIFPKSKPRSPFFQHDDVQLAETSNVTDRHSMVYNEVNDDIQNAIVVSPKQQQTNYGYTDVYNLLNESDNKEDKSEYYDHAGPAPSLSVMEEGYGSLFVEQGDNENYSEVDGATNRLGFGNILGKNHPNNNYSTLEANA